MKIPHLFKLIIFYIAVQNMAYAGGTLRSPIFGAKEMALNGLCTAAFGNLSDIYLNPAGLSYSEYKMLQLSGFFRSEQNSFDGSRGLFRSIYEDDLNFGAGIIYPLFNNFTAAVLVERVNDYRVNWPYVLLWQRDISTSTVASDVIYEARQNIISGAASYKTDNLSAGFSINVIRQKNKLSFAQSNFLWQDTIGLPQYQVEMGFDEWVWQANIGLLYQFSADLRAGVNITTGYKKDFSGSASTPLYQVTDSAAEKTNVATTFSSPWKISAGIIYKLSDIAALNLDLRYNLYASTPGNLNFSYSDPIWKNRSIIEDSITGFSMKSVAQQLKNSIDAGIGLSLAAASDLNFYLGYRFSQSPNSEKTYSLLFPAVSTNSFSAGFGYQDEDMLIEGSVVYYTGIQRDINDAAFTVHNGAYDESGIIPTLTLTFKL